MNARKGLVPIDSVMYAEDEMYPWDEGVIRKIREFDPGFAPFMLKRIYKSHTGEIVVRRYVGIGRHKPGANPDKRVHNFVQPIHPPSWYLRPTIVERHLQDPNDPDRFIPLDGLIAAHLRQCYDEMTHRERMRFIDERGPAAQARRARENAEAEAEYRAKTDARWLRGHIENITQEDAKRLLWEQAHPPKYEAKPFADVGATHVTPKEAA
jgi:hypothetical protein